MSITMHVLEVSCRHCGQKIELEVPSGDAMSFEEKLATIEKLAEAHHVCQPKAAEAKP